MKVSGIIILFTLVILWFVGCGDSNPESDSDNVVVVSIRQIDTVTHADSTPDKKLLSSTTEPLSEKNRRYAVTGTKYINLFDVSSTVIEYKSVDTTNLKLFITSRQSSQGIVVFDTIVKKESVIPGSLKMGLDTNFYRDTVETIHVTADTVFSLFVVATTTDYTTGNMGLAGAGGNFPTLAHQLSVHSDARVQSYKGALYITERLGRDNIIRINPAGTSILHPNNVAYQENQGTGVNLHDIAFVSETKAYVTQYGSRDLLIINPATGKKTGVISLASLCAYAGTDSVQAVPYMDQSLVVGSKAYVLCQRLKAVQTPNGVSITNSEQPGIIAVIATATDSLVAVIPLTKKNPASMDTVGNQLYVACTGSWSDATDGGIEQVDLSLDTCLGTVITETALSGNCGSLVMISTAKGYVAVSKYNQSGTKFWTELVSFNPGAKSVGSRVRGIEDAFGGLVYDGYYLFVGERSKTNPGIAVVNTDENAAIGSIRGVGLPPSSLTMLDRN